MVAARAKACTQGAIARTGLVQNLGLRLVADLTYAVEALDAERDRRIDAREPTRRVAEMLVCIPDVAGVTARNLIAGAPEIGTLAAREIAATTGTAPDARSSGQWRGKTPQRRANRPAQRAHSWRPLS